MTDRTICPQPCEHLSQQDAREGRECAEHPCTCAERPSNETMPPRAFAMIRLLINDLDITRDDGNVLTYGYIQHRLRQVLETAEREPVVVDDATARVVGVSEAARESRAWFTEKADEVLERIKTETTEDVMLYHDAVSVLVFARQLVDLIAALTPDRQETAR